MLRFTKYFQPSNHRSGLSFDQRAEDGGVGPWSTCAGPYWGPCSLVAGSMTVAPNHTIPSLPAIGAITAGVPDKQQGPVGLACAGTGTGSVDEMA